MNRNELRKMILMEMKKSRLNESNPVANRIYNGIGKLIKDLRSLRQSNSNVNELLMAISHLEDALDSLEEAMDKLK